MKMKTVLNFLLIRFALSKIPAAGALKFLSLPAGETDSHSFSRVKFLLGSIGLVGLLSLTGCGAKDNTPIPSKLTAYPFTVQPKILWKTDATSGSGVGTTLGLSETATNLISVGNNGVVALLDKKTGKILWTVKLKHEISSRAVSDEQRIFIPTRDGYLVALNFSNGQVLWSVQLSSTLLAGVCVESGIVIVHEHNGSVVGLDVTTGIKLWAYSGSTPSIELQGNSEPTANNSMAYVGMSQGQVFAFDLQTGAVKWNRPIAIPNGSTLILRMIDIDAAPLLGPSALYAVSYHGNLVALDPFSGQLIWQKSLSSYQNLASDFANNALFVTDENSDLFNIDTLTGATRWKQNALEYRTLSSPSVLKNHVLVGDYEGYVHVLSESQGTLEGRVRIDHSAVIAQGISNITSNGDGVDYFVTRSGEVVALAI